MQTLAVERGELAKRATDALKSPEVGAASEISQPLLWFFASLTLYASSHSASCGNMMLGHIAASCDAIWLHCAARSHTCLMSCVTS